MHNAAFNYKVLIFFFLKTHVKDKIKIILLIFLYKCMRIVKKIIKLSHIFFKKL